MSINVDYSEANVILGHTRKRIGANLDTPVPQCVTNNMSLVCTRQRPKFGALFALKYCFSIHVYPQELINGYFSVRRMFNYRVLECGQSQLRPLSRLAMRWSLCQLTAAALRKLVTLGRKINSACLHLIFFYKQKTIESSSLEKDDDDC